MHQIDLHKYMHQIYATNICTKSKKDQHLNYAPKRPLKMNINQPINSNNYQ